MVTEFHFESFICGLISLQVSDQWKDLLAQKHTTVETTAL